MATKVEMGQAQHVRRTEQYRLLSELMEKTREAYSIFGPADAFLMLMYMVGGALLRSRNKFSTSEFPDILSNRKFEIHHICIGFLEKINKFKGSQDERNKVLSMLLIWMSEEIARPYEVRYNLHEEALLQKLYGVKSATDLVPFG